MEIAICICYADEDGDYINLGDGDTQNFDEMLSHSQYFEDRNYRRIVLRVNELDSPLCQQEKKRKRTLCDKRPNLEPRSLTYFAENNECTFEEDIEENVMEKPRSSSNPTYTKRSMTVGKSPLEKSSE